MIISDYVLNLLDVEHRVLYILRRDAEGAERFERAPSGLRARFLTRRHREVVGGKPPETSDNGGQGAVRLATIRLRLLLNFLP